MTAYEKVEHQEEPKAEEQKVVKLGERKKLNAVVTKKAPRKKGVIERLVVAIIGPDGIPAISSYLNHEIILPAVKDVIVNSISSGVQMMMYGSDQAPRQSGIPRQYNRPSGNRNYYSNRTNYSGSSSHSSTPAYNRGRNGYTKPNRPDSVDTSSFPIEDRTEALDVLAALSKQAYDYGIVSLADFYDLIGIDSSFTDERWGWTSQDIEREGRVVNSGRDYAVLLPDPTRLK